jgi:hypothetical protein
MRTMTRVLRGLAVIAVLASVLWNAAPADASQAGVGSPTVHALFALSQPSDGPFPANWYTVSDMSNLTGVRVNLPLPEGVPPSDCAKPDADRPSVCDDLKVLNSLDGFNLQPQVSIPFDGAINLGTANSDSLFLVDIGVGRKVGINQRVWDPGTNTLHFESDDQLRQHTRYAVIATKDIRDTDNQSIKPAESFRNFLDNSCAGRRACAYQAALREGIAAAERAGTPAGRVVSASVFTTLSSTAVMEKVRDRIDGATPDPIDFVLASGRRTVFDRSAVSSVRFAAQTVPNVNPGSGDPLPLGPLDVVPGTVGQLAYGKYKSSDYQTATAVWPEIATKTGELSTGTERDIYVTMFLPSGAKPAGGWPVMVMAHGGTQHKDEFLLRHASIAASHGIATLGINTLGHGFGPASRLSVQLSGEATPVQFLSGGRGFDQDGNGEITNREGDRPVAPYAMLWERDALRQSAADLLQLVRQLEVGVDVDGDGATDLDGSRINLAGFSLGSNYTALAAAVAPSVKAVMLNAPGGALPELLRLAPSRRAVFGATLGARKPASLLNSEVGIAEMDGLAVTGPATLRWNESKPLRNEPVAIAVAGSMPIQELLDRTEWAFQTGNVVAYVPHYRQDPLAGVPAKRVLLQGSKGDQTIANPAMTALLRASGLADVATFYRTDLARKQDPSIPTNQHGFLNQQSSPNTVIRDVSRGAQHQIGTFFESGGATIVTPSPANLFETPIALPLPEVLNYSAVQNP